MSVSKRMTHRSVKILMSQVHRVNVFKNYTSIITGAYVVYEQVLIETSGEFLDRTDII